MTTSTPNLSLLLYDSGSPDNTATFATFRSAIAGVPVTSNFYKIDTAYGSMDSRITTLESIAQSATLVNALWVSSGYYEATVAGITAYSTGMSIILKLDTDTDASATTLNISSLGTKSVMKIDSSATPINIGVNQLQAGRYYLFIYDGTRWVWANATTADQIYNGGTTGNVVLVDSVGAISDSTTKSLLLSGTINSATGKTTPVDADELGIVDSAASNVLKKLTWANLKATFMTSLGALTNALTGKTTPVDADEFILNDSAASNATKKLTWANLKATMATYYDSLTSTMTNKRVNPRVGSTTSSATPTINTDNYDAYSITAQAVAITSMTTNLSGTPVNFQKLIIRIKDDGTARAITWGASFEAKGVALPTTTVISKVLTVGFIYDTVTSKWGCVASAQET